MLFFAVENIKHMKIFIKKEKKFAQKLIMKNRIEYSKLNIYLSL